MGGGEEGGEKRARKEKVRVRSAPAMLRSTEKRHLGLIPDTNKTLNFLEFKQEILRYEAFPQ